MFRSEDTYFFQQSTERAWNYILHISRTLWNTLTNPIMANIRKRNRSTSYSDDDIEMSKKPRLEYNTQSVKDAILSNKKQLIINLHRADINNQEFGEADNSSNAASEGEQDDPDNDPTILYMPGDVLHERYKIMSVLGEGSFGKVFKVKNLQVNQMMAMKVLKKTHLPKDEGRSEISLLKKIMRRNPRKAAMYCVKMLDWFKHGEHMCIVFELLGTSVYDFLQYNDYQPYHMDQIRHIAHQLCSSVKFLHDQKIIHTDLKPENILFLNSNYEILYDEVARRDFKRLLRTDVKLIDFGNAIYNYESHPHTIQTRHYRAPEVIMYLEWNEASDVWSIGCILLEMYMGKTLFNISNNLEHLAMMQKVFGEIPISMINRSKAPYFHEGKLLSIDDGQHHVEGGNVFKPLEKYQVLKIVGHYELFDLIKKMLVYEPSQRITLNAALKHAFFKRL